MIVGKETGGPSVEIDALDPFGIAAQIRRDVSTITPRIERSDHPVAIRPNPHPHVERYAHGSVLGRNARPSRRRGSPSKFLRGKAFDAGVGQDARERGGKPKAV